MAGKYKMIQKSSQKIKKYSKVYKKKKKAKLLKKK
tara:strand:+ start:2573 stop:2677 length:105 start_codon:yes stop_codon:yes gene_type:complete